MNLFHWDFVIVAAITGSIISSTVLKPTPAENETFASIDDDVLAFCGAKDCPGKAENNTNLAPVSHDVTVSEMLYYSKCSTEFP